jgi:hypothetical protein
VVSQTVIWSTLHGDVQLCLNTRYLLTKVTECPNPNSGVCMNLSKETTKKEIISVEGVDEHTRRMCTINLSAGHVNALEICTNLLGMPTLDQMLESFNKTLAA